MILPLHDLTNDAHRNNVDLLLLIQYIFLFSIFFLIHLCLNKLQTRNLVLPPECVLDEYLSAFQRYPEIRNKSYLSMMELYATRLIRSMLRHTSIEYLHNG